MSGFELTQDLNSALRAYSESVTELKGMAVALASAGAGYKRSKAVEIARLRAEKVPATVAESQSYASPGVSGALEERDALQALWDAQREVVQLRKREVDVIREQMQREAAMSGRLP